MAMGLFTVHSKKEQVTDVLRRQIQEGKISPGTKLSSVRDLSKMFSVSTQILVNAFDTLEKERLIRREQGRGVFVCTPPLQDIIDVGIMGYRISNASDFYFGNLARISHPPYLKPGFSFIVRTVPSEDVFDDNRFGIELNKFEQLLHVNCLLVNAPSINRRQLELALKLKTNVIFIGDFSIGTHPDVTFNQIAGDNAWIGETMFRQVLEKEKCTEMTIYTYSLQNYFYRETYEGIRRASETTGVKLHLVEFPRFSLLSEPERQQVFKDTIRAAAEQGLMKYPSINTGIHEGQMREAFESAGQNPRIYAVRESEESLQKFYDTIYERIRAVVSNPSDVQKIRHQPAMPVKLS